MRKKHAIFFVCRINEYHKLGKPCINNVHAMILCSQCNMAINNRGVSHHTHLLPIDYLEKINPHLLRRSYVVSRLNGTVDYV